MSMIEVNSELIVEQTIQGTDDWRLARLGKATGSRIADVVAKTKSGWGASRYNYKAELVRERLTGRWVEGYKSAAMRRGNEVEPEARSYYEISRGVDVVQVGFVDHPRIDMSGSSPDGLVGTDGLIEIKVPEDKNHLETLLNEKIDGDYVKQIQWNLAVTGRKWADYISYHPDMPAEIQCWVKRIYRDDALIAELEREVPIFLKEVDAQVDAIVKKYNLTLPA